MRALTRIFALTATLALCSLTILGQPKALYFHPGNWEINSSNTASDGRVVTSATHLCAKEQMDFWKVEQTGMVCKPPKIFPISAGAIRVRVSCEYDSGPLHSDIRTSVVETFSDNGSSFTAVGTSTTNTVYQGVQPKQTSVKLQAKAHRTGPCK